MMHSPNQAERLETEREHDRGYGEATFVATKADTDQRRDPRFRVELEVHLGSEHNFYAGFVENLSAGGVFIATHQLRSVGDKLELSIRLPNRETPVTGIGEVRWLREPHASDQSPGMGLRFLVLEPGGDEAIEEFTASRDPMFFDDEP